MIDVINLKEMWSAEKRHVLSLGLILGHSGTQLRRTTAQRREATAEEVMAPAGRDEFFTRCKLHIKY